MAEVKMPRCLTLHEMSEVGYALLDEVSSKLTHKEFIALAHECADLLSGDSPALDGTKMPDVLGRLSTLFMERVDDWPSMLVDAFEGRLPFDMGHFSLDEWTDWHGIEPLLWRDVAINMARQVRPLR